MSRYDGGAIGVLGANLLLECLRDRYVAGLGSELESPRSALASWAIGVSRRWSYSKGSGWSGRYRLHARV
jgi:hypothetical protein